MGDRAKIVHPSEGCIDAKMSAARASGHRGCASHILDKAYEAGSARCNGRTARSYVNAWSLIQRKFENMTCNKQHNPAFPN